MKIRFNRTSLEAFTLVEVVVSASLMSIILVAAYLCLNAGLSGEKTISTRAEMIQNARVAMSMISTDLRCASPLCKDFAFIGMQRKIGDADADNLDFATHHFKPKHPGGRGLLCHELFSGSQSKNRPAGSDAQKKSSNPD